MRRRLRLYTGDEDGGSVTEPQVTRRLGEITKILADAASWDRTWLSDFDDDEIRISADLHEVLSAYSHLRPSA